MCLFNRKYFLKIVYKETVTNGIETKEYIGSSGVSFKTRFNQYMHNFKPNIKHKPFCISTYAKSRIM